MKKVKEIIEKSYSKEDLKDYSKFCLVHYLEDDETGKITIIGVLPIKNGVNDIRSSQEEKRGKAAITDRSGRILIPFNSYDDNKYYTILYAKDGNILTGYSFRNEMVSIFYDEGYDEKRKEKQGFNTRCLCVYHKDVKDSLQSKIIFPCEGKDTFIINTINDGKYASRLYSLEKKKYISPTFSLLAEEVETDGEVLLFSQNVESDETYDYERAKSSFIGFITIDGKFADEIYDEHEGEVISVDFNNDDEFRQYEGYKNNLKERLNCDIRKLNTQEEKLENLEKKVLALHKKSKQEK